MSEATEDVVSYIELWLNNVNVQPEINQDNEMRNLSVSALLKLNAKLYKETSIKVIEDVYKPGANLVPVMDLPETSCKECFKNKRSGKNENRQNKRSAIANLQQSGGNKNRKYSCKR